MWHKINSAFLIFVLSFSQVLWATPAAGSLAFTKVTDTTLNQHFWGLSNLHGLPNSPAKKAQFTEAIDVLLNYMTQTIQASPGYQNPFFLNCTVYFNTQVEQISCDSNFDPADGLEPASDQRAFLLPRIKQLQRSHILWTQVYVDWSNGKYQNSHNQLYFRQPWDVTETEEQTTSESESLSQKRSRTRVLSASVSATAPKSLSGTPTALTTPTAAISASKSATQTRTSTPELVPGHTIAVLNVSSLSGSGRNVGSSQNVAALTWQLSRKGMPTMTQTAAISYCASLAGWRLPTIWELYTLYQQRNVLGADSDTRWFWASTAVVGVPNNAWAVSFSSGGLGYNVIGSYPAAVRCVASFAR